MVVAMGEAAQTEHQFRAGDRISGAGVPVADSRTEIAELYKVSKLRVLERGPDTVNASAPWLSAPPPLSVYREHVREEMQHVRLGLPDVRRAREDAVRHRGPDD